MQTLEDLSTHRERERQRERESVGVSESESADAQTDNGLETHPSKNQTDRTCIAGHHTGSIWHQPEHYAASLPNTAHTPRLQPQHDGVSLPMTLPVFITRNTATSSTACRLFRALRGVPLNPCLHSWLARLCALTTTHTVHVKCKFNSLQANNQLVHPCCM